MSPIADPRFACPCCGKNDMTQEALDAFAALERALGHLQVNSGFRCPKHNEAVGGAKLSQHLLGRAFDVATEKAAQDAFISAAKVAGFRGFGLGSDFTHIDVRKFPATWTY